MGSDATKLTTGPFGEPGDSIGPGFQGHRYRLVAELGTGALGSVYRAEEEATGHRVALRILPLGLAGGPEAAKAVRVMGPLIVDASTTHPTLVRIQEFGEAEKGRPFAAMEFLQGRRLSEILSTGELLEVGTALRWALELGGAVEMLHNLGLVHGALRPCNVMMLEDGRVKLMDVELVGLRDAPAMASAVIATPSAEYRAPEQIRQAPVTEKTDVYSFAVTLYEMLCGVPLFPAASREVVLAAQLTGPPVRMGLRQRAVPVAVQRLVRQALDKEPEPRPCMSDILNQLWPVNTAPLPWKPPAAMVGGTALAASLALLVVWGLVAPRPAALRSLVQWTLLLASEDAPESPPPESSAFVYVTRVAPGAEPAPAMAPSALASAPSQSGALWIQVGAFRNPEAATRLAARLRRHHYRVEESSVSIGEQDTSGGSRSTRVPGRASAADKYDVVVSGGPPAAIAAKLSMKGFSTEPTRDAVVVRPSMSLAKATALSRDLAISGWKVHVRPSNSHAAAAATATTAGETLHRVRLGPYADRAAATPALLELEGKGYKPFITR